MAIFFPSYHIFPNEQVLFKGIRPCLSNDTVYDDGMEVPTILEDEPVDVIALLSGHGGSGFRVNKRDYLITNNADLAKRRKVPVKSLRGKYVLICCFLIPALRNSKAAAFSRAVIAFISDLPENQRQNFQVVIVPKLMTGVEPLYYGLFHYPFTSAFPDDCLIIPPSDTYSCDYVCKSLELSTKTGMAALTVDPQQMVLQHDLYPASALENFGAAGFPFTESHILKLRQEDDILRMRFDVVYKENFLHDDLEKYGSSPVSLEELLEGQSLFNMNTQTEVQLSYFSDKLVGLYIYYDGQFMEELGEVLKDCKNEGLSFEIVLIPLSCRDDPSFILCQIFLGLQKHKISASNCWTFPFNHKLCQKLWRMVDFDDMDKLIIVPPPGDKKRSGDLQGKAVIRDFGGVKAYPFTRETILERQLAALSLVTVESLLKEYDHLVRNGDVSCNTTVADLRGKNILLYFDNFESLPHGLRLYNEIHSRYSEIQAKYPGSEVVFAPLNSSEINLKGEVVSKMPWLILPFFSPYLKDQLQLNGSPCCVAFGKDGRVRSREAGWGLNKVSSLFDDHLRKEIVVKLYQLNQDCH